MVERLSETFVPLLPLTLRSREAMSETSEENDMVAGRVSCRCDRLDL